MNSTKRKLKYTFRIHNLDELNKCLYLLKNRRFDVHWQDDTWSMYGSKPSVDSFLLDVEERKEKDFMIRCYFNCDHKLMRFHKTLKEKLPEWKCGNVDCSFTDCPYFIDNGSKERPVEWVWRCILADEGQI